MDNINIADSEWKVMEVVWKEPGITIGRIRSALADSGWSYSTIKTLVLRLVKKNILRAEDSELGKRYYAEVSERESKIHETHNFLDKIFEGSVKRMVSNLVTESSLSDEDVKELMKLVDKMED